jgi:hypothetical protein
MEIGRKLVTVSKRNPESLFPYIPLSYVLDYSTVPQGTLILISIVVLQT